MVAVLPALAMAAPQLIQSGFGFLKGRDQLRRQNRQIDRLEEQDQLAFLRQNQEYDAYVLSETNAYYKDLENLTKTYGFNAKARQRSIESGLTQLSDISDGFIQKAFSRNLRAAEATGRRLATGQTGKSVRRLEGLGTDAVRGRGGAADAGSMDSAVGAFMFREKEAQFQQEVANQNAFNQVRKPIFGPRPVAPQDRIRPEDNTTRELLFGAGSALASGFLGQFQAEQGLNFLANNIPGGGGSNRSLLSNAASGPASLSPGTINSPWSIGDNANWGGNLTNLFGGSRSVDFGSANYRPF
jgi:hypothetical protein